MRTATTTAKAAADQNRSKLPTRLRDEAICKLMGEHEHGDGAVWSGTAAAVDLD
jgi:hypothetical protein